MFAVCQPDIALNTPFHEGQQDPTLGTAFLGDGEHRQDTNFNFVAGVYDRNENWSQPALRDAAQSLKGDQARLRADVRSPPEGAEVGGPGDEKAAVEDTAKECRKPLSSPVEDNGYASSSLSIDSPDSVSGSAWEPPTSPDTDHLFPALAEAFQHIQDKERFKEQEKEKHHIQLVMYRRLALLRWIHSLQQKVVDQQNRLQESFDTILDNRKELIRYIQQGLACPGAPDRPGL
uniref:Chromosome 1 open reading frame 216 n=1 Tax=Apteryx owenii TaxID=8824 RepID=A0A8B9S9D2_APTOW